MGLRLHAFGSQELRYYRQKKFLFLKPLKLWAYLISAGRVTTTGITQKNYDNQQTWDKDFHFASRAVPCKSLVYLWPALIRHSSKSTLHSARNELHEKEASEA